MRLDITDYLKYHYEITSKENGILYKKLEKFKGVYANINGARNDLNTVQSVIRDILVKLADASEYYAKWSEPITCKPVADVYMMS